MLKFHFYSQTCFETFLTVKCLCIFNCNVFCQSQISWTISEVWSNPSSVQCCCLLQRKIFSLLDELKIVTPDLTISYTRLKLPTYSHHSKFNNNLLSLLPPHFLRENISSMTLRIVYRMGNELTLVILNSLRNLVILGITRLHSRITQPNVHEYSKSNIISNIRVSLYLIWQLIREVWLQFCAFFCNIFFRITPE